MATQSALTLFSPAEHPTLTDVATSTWKGMRDERTWENDTYCLRYWDRCFPNLAAATITVEHSRKFRRYLDGLVKAGQLVEETANKIARGVNRFLKLIGPDDGSYDENDPYELKPVPLLERAIKIKAPPIPEREVTSPIELLESGLFLAAAAEAKWTNHRNRRAWRKPPPRLSAPCWWHEVWIFLYNSALRPCEALKVKPGDLYTDPRGRWLKIRKEVAKTKRARDVYLNRWAAAAVDTLLIAKGKTILDWQCGQNWLDECRRQIFKRAGLARLLAAGIGFKGLRSACSTELAALCSGEIAGKHLGHRSKSVTMSHYIAPWAVIPHVDRLPQPELQKLPLAVLESRDQQLTLFDFL